MAFDPNLRPGVKPDALSPKCLAAGYLRSATELKGDALHEQIDAIVRYARAHSLQLIRLYCDECGSGLRIDGRTGLQQMFRDIETGGADFDTILLLDPSRWGRPDQSACLEYACRQARIEVQYCAEEHLADGKIAFSAVAKRPKRFMADEGKREMARDAASDTAAHEGAANRPEESAGG